MILSESRTFDMTRVVPNYLICLTNVYANSGRNAYSGTQV